MYGSGILICPATYETVKAKFHTRFIDKVEIGIEPNSIYEILGPSDQALLHDVMTVIF